MDMTFEAGVAEAHAEISEVTLHTVIADMGLALWAVTPTSASFTSIEINGASISAVAPDFEKVGG